MGRSRRRCAAIVGVALVLGTVAGGVAPAAADEPPGDPWVVTNPTFEPLDGSPLGVAGVGEYRGSIALARSGSGLAVVNHVALDDYLRGISEVPTNWPIEAQKAQAVAARTYALHEAATTGTTAAYKAVGADICATDACQVYRGLDKERRPGSEAWIAAVEQTRNQVLTYKGAPIVAKYSSSNGGQTVAGGQPYLRAAPDPDDAYSPLHEWQVAYPIGDVVRAVGLAAEPTAMTRQGDEVVASYLDPEGNVVEQRVAAADFRSRLNAGVPTPAGFPLPVPSVRFDVAADGGTVQIHGRGWGHGIGLSQYGALGKALRGLKAPDILAAYYAGLRPVTLPPDRLPKAVRVAVALDRPGATVTDHSGRFRIVDADGRVVAQSATGVWSAKPAAGNQVRLVPPADQAGLPGAALASMEPAVPRPGSAIVARVDLGGPAATTRITLTAPDGTTRELDGPRLRLPGPVTVKLGPATTATPGVYHLVFERDAGGGRAATTTLDIGIEPAPAAAVAPPSDVDAAPPASSRLALATRLPVGALQGLASVLLVAVASAGALWVGRRPGVQLH